MIETYKILVGMYENILTTNIRILLVSYQRKFFIKYRLQLIIATILISENIFAMNYKCME